MDEHVLVIIDALAGVKLLPRRAFEADVLYGYVDRAQQEQLVARVCETLRQRGYELHRCAWPDEVVLLALDGTAHPFALRLTASATERYNLYALSRPRSAQQLWQWAQAMLRQQARQRREPRS